MPRRLEDVTCPICMDSLFTKLSDLDEPIPISTADCGHVFHHECVEAWFHSQGVQYVAMARDQGREMSPSEAPAECPTCRTECFADPETGQPMLHRLFINFGEVDGQANSSSPVVPSSVRKRDRDVMGLARRARDLGEQVKQLDRDSQVDVFDSAVGRAEQLKEDMVSVKAQQGIKTYVGGLTAALNNLRASVEANPLTHQFQNQIQGMRLQNIELTHQLRELQRNDIPREIEKALVAERAKWSKRVQKLQQEKDLIQTELNKETVMRKALRRETEEKLEDSQRTMEHLRRQLGQEAEAKDDISRQLAERTKQLVAMRAKVDSRKTLKNQLEEVQAENSKLRVSLTTSTSTHFSPPPPRNTSRSKYFDSDASIPSIDADRTDASIQEIDFDAFSSKRPVPTKKRTSGADDLEVEDPSMSSFMETIPADLPGPSRKNPTARTISSATIKDIFADDVSPRKRAKQRGYYGVADEPPTKAKGNPFLSDKAATERRKHLLSLAKGKGKAAAKARAIEVDHEDEEEIAEIRVLSPRRDNAPETKRTAGLILADAQGRPMKGLALGAPRVSRR